VAAKIISFQQFLKVVWQSNNVESHHVTRKLLDTAWMHIAVRVAILVQEIDCGDYLLKNVKQFKCCEFLLWERFPLA